MHSNITTRLAPKQASKRHKHSDPHVTQPQRQAAGVDHPPQTAQAPSNSKFVAPVAAPRRQHVDNSHAEQIVAAAPAARSQHARHEGPTPPARLPTAQAPVDMEVDAIQEARIQAGQWSSSIAPTNGLSSRTSHAQPQRIGGDVQQSSHSISSSSRIINSFDAADASIFADRLHTMQADAMDRAWQKQHQQQRLASTAPASTSAAVNTAAGAAPWPCSLPQPSESMSATSSHAIVKTVSSSAGQHQGVSSQQAGCIPDSSQSASSASNNATAARWPLRHQAELKPVSKPSAAAKPVSTGTAELSTETESLVVKLRALSQGRSSSDHSKACRSDSGQPQRLPFASRTANRNQPPAEPPALPPSKRSKHSSNAADAHQPAAARPADQRRPDTARCIQLMEPVHSGTEYDSTTSPRRRSHRLKSRAASPSASSRHRSSYSSVAAPIQLGPPMQQRPAAALPDSHSTATAAGNAAGASAGAAAATDAAATSVAAPRVHQQPPASPVQHRLGKPTPLKKGFTPKPTRFRLEAERLSITPPDKSSGLEKVLFRSPVKPAAQPSTSHAPSSSNQGRAVAIPAAVPEAGALAKDLAGQQQQAEHLRQDVASCNVHMADAEDGQELVTPANACSSGLQAIPEGVFACMRVILDPELTPEESDRYS